MNNVSLVALSISGGPGVIDKKCEPDIAPQKGADVGSAWGGYSILVVDDEEGMRSFIQRSLRHKVGRVHVAPNAEEGARLVERIHYDAIVLDIWLPGKSGTEWLEQLRQIGFTGEVILITAFAEMSTAIAAVRAGASDFILKPFRLDALLTSLQRCFDRLALRRENVALRREMAHFSDYEGITGSSHEMRNLGELIRRIAPMPTTVLLQGESGTGKELVARALHQLSPRSGRPFVTVNCAAIPVQIIESELFGHVKGAFTGAHGSREGLFLCAHGGTLFLDEITEMPLDLQCKLLRSLEERTIRPVGSEKETPIDVRIIAASNRNIRQEVSERRFREDLFYRLDVMSLRIPPLRERKEDIDGLLEHFQPLLAARLGVPMIQPPAYVLAALRDYPWPGNVRELRNFVERALILGYFPVENLTNVTLGAVASTSCSEDLTLEEIERRHILASVSRVHGNRAEAARRLGVSRKTLDRKFREWGI